MRLIGQMTVSAIGCILISIGGENVNFIVDLAASVTGLGMILGVGISIGRECDK